MTKEPMPSIDWNKLLKNVKNGDSTAIQIDNSTISREGRRIDYFGSRGRRIFEYDEKKNGWNVSERDGSRWEPILAGPEEQSVLDQYRTSLEKYSSRS